MIEVLTDRRGDRRRANHEALARVALRLAVAHGPDGFTVDQVARESGISRRSFFNHFASKEDAVIEVARARFNRILAPLVDDAPRPDLVIAHGVRALLDPQTVTEMRALLELSRTHPALVPHLAALCDESIEAFVRATARMPWRSPVHTYAVPGAAMAVVTAVYTRALHVPEIDGPAVPVQPADVTASTDDAGPTGPGVPVPVVHLDDIVDQLLVLVPVMSPDEPV